jgi:hypothetical protein
LKPGVLIIPWPPTLTWIEEPDTGMTAVACPPRPAGKLLPEPAPEAPNRSKLTTVTLPGTVHVCAAPV